MSSRRIRQIAIAAACLATVATTAAQASPFAGQYRYLDSGTVRVHGADGANWLLRLGATADGQVESRGEQRLYIALSRCVGSDCRPVGSWSRPLNTAEISINKDFTSGRLRTTLGGYPLDVALQSRPTGTPVDGLAVDSLGLNGLSARPGVSRSYGAKGTLAIGRLKCLADPEGAELGEVTEADTTGDDARVPAAPPSRLPKGFLAGKAVANC